MTLQQHIKTHSSDSVFRAGLRGGTTTSTFLFLVSVKGMFSVGMRLVSVIHTQYWQWRQQHSLLQT